MSEACDSCLRRGHLVGFLAPRVAGLLERPRTRVASLLALPDDRLIAAVCAGDQESAWRFLEGFDPRRAWAHLGQRRLTAVCPHGETYPVGLRDLVDVPAALFVAGAAGQLPDLSGPTVAIVGARRATAYGREVARELGRGLAVAGVPVISGMALGIDGEAHRGTLAGGGCPVAVLAGGADVPYPRSHQRLYDDIVAHGAAVSELPPGQKPFRWSFPARNRIMAGLATVTVVVEAAERSGSLITTEFASDLQRTVAAVPGPVTTAMAAGSNALLRDGALVVTGVADLLDELFGVMASRELRLDVMPLAIEVDPADRALLSAVEAESGIDRVCLAAGCTAEQARAGLSRLEALGLVSRAPLGGYRRTALAASAPAADAEA